MAKAVIIDNPKTKVKVIKSKTYPNVKIKQDIRTVRINDVLPFRVRFTTIGLEAYGSNNAPAIPFQVIGYSNYIL